MPAVLITGAARGFGRALLDEYLGRGWTAFPLVRGLGDAEPLAERERCHPVVGDVTTPPVEEAIAAALRAHDVALDLLVNNAGGIKKLRGLAVTVPEDLDELFGVHCVGVLRCTRAALPWLRRAPRATVVNVSSRFGSITRTAAGEWRGIYSYPVAKAAQNMLTACLDRELASEGIRVFALHPGALRTPLGAVDADTDPADAARAFAAWVQAVDRDAPCGFHDLGSGGLIPW